MKFSSILDIFAEHFATDKENVSETNSLDTTSELLSQLPATSWKGSDVADHSGLFLGCPLTNDKRQLTSGVALWCPNGWPDGNFESIVSSRLGNRLFQDELIATALRNFFLLTPSNETILSGYKTTLHEPVQRGCRLFSRKLLQLTPFPKRITEAWIESTRKPLKEKVFNVYFDDSAISVDEIVFALSDHVRVIHTRIGGTINELLNRFQASDIGPLVWQLVGDSAKNRESTSRAVDWYLCDSALGTAADTKSATRADRNQIAAPIIELNSITDQEEFLAHWTRADRVAFPDQTQMQRFDTLFFGGENVTSPMDTLCRILSQQKLLGSGRLVRGGQRVVCFTEVPLREFARRRVFRPQLSRWDFELYGLAIRKSVLMDRDARPVTYIDHGSMGSENNPFHVVLSKNAELDWAEEQEWRLLGDLDLRQIPAEAAFVFVPDQGSAEKAARLSRWPVAIVGGGVEQVPFGT